MRDYEAIALQYAQDITAGNIPACEIAKQACQRQLDDLDRYADGSVFIWNPTLERKGVTFNPVHRVCNFIENLPHVDAQWAGQPIELEPWQIFVISTVFGWVRPDGYRRFRDAYLEVPRKNGKSLLLSAIALYMLLDDFESGAQVFSAARQKDQAKVVWDVSRRLVNATKALQDHFGVKAQKHSCRKHGV